MDPLMKENCRYALDLVTDEELDIVVDDILLLGEGYAEKNPLDVFLSEE